MTDDIQLELFIWIMIWLQSHFKASASKMLEREDFIILKYYAISGGICNEWPKKGIER